MGATTRQIIFSALLPEARPGIIAAITVTAITLVSYTAMAGVVVPAALATWPSASATSASRPT